MARHSGSLRQRQIDQGLDGTAANAPPDLIVFGPHFLLCRVRRPVHTDALQILQAQLDPAIAAIQGCVELQAQTGYRGAVNEGRRARRQLASRCSAADN